MTTRISLLFLILAAVLMSCGKGSKDYRDLKAKNDSLETIIRNDRKLIASFERVSHLIESINAGQHMSHHRSVVDQNPEMTIGQMQAIALYVNSCREKIDSLQHTLKSTKSLNNNYFAALQNLENNLKIREDELSMMDEVVVLSMNQNDNLIHIVNLQRSEIDDKMMRLRFSENESERLHSGINLFRPRTTATAGMLTDDRESAASPQLQNSVSRILE